MRPISVLLFVTLSLVGCSRSATPTAATPVNVAPSPPAETSDTFSTEFVVGDPVSFENLTLFPICSKVPKSEDRFITLDEGLEAGTVKIIEVGAAPEDTPLQDPFAADRPAGAQPENADRNDPFAEPIRVAEPDNSPANDPFGGAPVGTQLENTPANDPFGDSPVRAQHGNTQSDPLFGNAPVGQPHAEVNKLLVFNTSGKPLFLMPGEVISGGRQDRTIGEEIVIQPGNTPVPIDVYCVEAGRWSGRSIASTTNLLASNAEGSGGAALANFSSLGELAEKAARGEFVASVGHLNKDSRLAVQYLRSQGHVWDEVSKMNARVANSTDTDNFAKAYFDPDLDRQLTPYLENFSPLAETDQIVGVAVAVNGKLLSADWFESTPLFLKFWPKLLKSYALDAVASRTEDGAAITPCTRAECLAFLNEIVASKCDTEQLAAGERIDRRESPGTISFSYYDSEAADAAGLEGQASAGLGGGGFSGGLGGAVHSGGFSK